MGDRSRRPLEDDETRSSPKGSEGQTTHAAPPRGGSTTGALPVGTVLAGRFRVVDSLGVGGMGVVYEAEDLELRERVALKTVRPDMLGDETTLDRFRVSVRRTTS